MRFFELSRLTSSPVAAEFRSSDFRLDYDADGQLTGYRSRPVQPSVTIEKGTKWTDVIGGFDGRGFFLLLSDRATDAFHNAGIRGYELEPVRIDKIRSKPLRSLAAPWYSLLKPVGEIDLDFTASGIPAEEITGDILSGRGRPMPARFVMNERSWDGSDFLKLRNFPTGHVFCTERIVKLAREHHLTNFRFMPIELPAHQKLSWRKGVDYLGRKWPPRWEPPHARESKTLEEWLAILRAEQRRGGWEVYKEVYEPLMDFGIEAVPGLFQILTSGNKEERENAAYALFLLRVNDELRLPRKVTALAEEYLSPEQAAILQKQR